MLCSCGRTLPDAYDQAGLAAEDMMDHSEDGFKAPGFASALCVPESDTDLNTDGVNAAAFGLFDTTNGTVVSQGAIFDKVYPACGSANSAIGMTIGELEEASEYIRWVEVCKMVDA